MLVYAMESAFPCTIILISGDRDFLYAVSVLRLRKCRVVLMAPGTAHTSLKAQASAVFEWPRDILQADSIVHALGEPSALRERGGSVRSGLPTPLAPKTALPPSPTTPTAPVVPPPPPSPMMPTYSRAGASSSVLGGTRARVSTVQHARSVSLPAVESSASGMANTGSGTSRKSFADIVVQTGSGSPTEGNTVRDVYIEWRFW